MAGGYTLSLPEEDSNYRTKKQMLDEIVTLLGGRCSEQLILDDISTGASNDLERTTAIAKAMVTRYGFSEKLGNVVYGHDPEQTFLGRDYSQGQGYSESVASEIDTEIRKLVDEGYQRCLSILKNNIDKLHIVAKILMTQEKITGEEFKEIMAEGYVYVEPVIDQKSEEKVRELLQKADIEVEEADDSTAKVQTEVTLEGEAEATAEDKIEDISQDKTEDIQENIADEASGEQEESK